MTADLQHDDRHIIAARVVGQVEQLLHRGLIHPTKQAELGALVRAYNAAIDPKPTAEIVARDQGRST